MEREDIKYPDKVLERAVDSYLEDLFKDFNITKEDLGFVMPAEKSDFEDLKEEVKDINKKTAKHIARKIIREKKKDG